MSRRTRRSSYADAIDKVRAEHQNTTPVAKVAMECPRCGTKQMVPDVPGQRFCVKCGFEFKPPVQGR